MKSIQNRFEGLMLIVLVLMFASCKLEDPGQPYTMAASNDRLQGDSLLTTVQQHTFQYFWDGAEANSGMARERYHLDEPSLDEHVVTTGGSGFGLMAILVGIERGFISRKEGMERLTKITGFLEKADRFHGVWPHWLDGRTGKTLPFSPKDNGGDLVETSFLAAGILAVRQYLDVNDPRENQLHQRLDDLWKGIEWNWHTKGGEDVLYWHWSPEFEWEMNFAIDGYNECLITYLMAAASPDHAIDPEVYHRGWAENGSFVTENSAYGYDLILKHNYAEEYGGPLFWAHYSYLGLDPRGLSDRYADYWALNKNHTLINRQWCIENPNDFEGYGENCWGLTSSYSINFYHGHRPGDDVGVISPTAVLSSMPYTPEESMQAMEFFYNDLGDKIWGKYGFYDAFSIEHDWYTPRYLAIDQGPIVVMLENYRSGLIWELFMSAPEVQEGLERLGFAVEQ